MRLNSRLLLFFLCLTLIFSCKTAEDSSEEILEEEMPNTAAVEDAIAAEPQEGSRGAETQALQSADQIIEETPEETVTEPEPLIKEMPEERQETSEKTLPPRGGLKSRPVSDNEEAEPVLSITDESDTRETAAEEIDVMTKTEAPAAESLPEIKSQTADPLTPIAEIVETPDTAEPVVIRNANEDLPSETDEIPSNPLIPIIVDTQKKPPVNNQDIRELPPDDDNAAESVPQPVPEEPLLMETTESVTEYTEIGKGGYSLSTDPSGKLVIHLDGTGWVFLSGSGKSELKLRDKSYEPASGKTRFVFSLKDDSTPDVDAELFFLKQDLLKGESQQKVLKINGNDSPFNEEITEEDKTEEDTVIVSNSLTGSDGGSRSEESADNAGTEATDQEVIADSEAPQVMPAPQHGENSQEESPDLPEDLNNYNASELYELALRYEQPGSGQSLETAMELYMKIKKDFPVTEERFKAESRIRYLNKHYFKVQ